MRDPELRVAVIVASTREARIAPTIVEWFLAEKVAIDGIEVDLIDLTEVDLPPYQAAKPAFMGDYDSQAIRDFGARIDRADAFVIITPEYNHGYPASLKHALDSVYHEWKGKPVGFISYGGISGGVRAIEQLRGVMAELHTVTIRNHVSFPMVRSCFDEDGRAVNQDVVSDAATTMMTELLWWAGALRDARSQSAFPV